MDDDQRRKSTDRSQRSTPWGFWLVLTAIVVVAVVYSVTLYFIGGEIKNPATAIGAMTAASTGRTRLRKPWTGRPAMKSVDGSAR